MLRARAWTERANRFERGEWPWTGTVYKAFGRWNAMVEAAGLPIHDSPHDMVGAAHPLDDDTLAKLVAEAISADDQQERKALLLGAAEVAMGLADVISDPDAS